MRSAPAVPLARITRAALNAQRYLKRTRKRVKDLAAFCGVHVSTAWDWLHRNKRPALATRPLIERFTEGEAKVPQWNEIVPVPAARRRALRPTGSD